MPGDLSRPPFKHFFQCPADVFDFFGRDFHYRHPSHLNHGTLEFDIAMSKFPKMFDEDSILRIPGSCDDCGGGAMKLAAEKIKPTFLIFLVRFSSPIEGPTMIAMLGGACVVG